MNGKPSVTYGFKPGQKFNFHSMGTARVEKGGPNISDLFLMAVVGFGKEIGAEMEARQKTLWLSESRFQDIGFDCLGESNHFR